MTSPSPASSTTPPSAEGERILLLECRLEQARSALVEARADADRLRTRLADAAAREADHARRYSTVHQELAEARAEIVSLHERLERSEALRTELEGHLFESGARDDVDELIRLRREVLAQRDRCVTSERAASRLRTRVDDLLQSREALLSRVAAWQRLVRQDGPEAVDLAEFMAELRRDILDLEHRTTAGERREAALRERLIRAGVDPGVKADDVPSAAPVVVVSYRDSEAREPTHARVSRRAGDNLYLVQPIPDDAAAAEQPAPDDILAAGLDDARFTGPIETADDALIEALNEEERVESAAAAVAEEEAAAVVEEADAAVVEEAAADVVDEADAAVVDEADADVVEEADAAAASIDQHDGAPVEPQEIATAPPAQHDVAAEDGRADAPDIAAEAPIVRDVPEDESTPVRAGAGVIGAPPVVGAAAELTAADPDTRAAAYGRMIPLLDGDRLAEHLRAGLADPHPRVRRRTVLAAAAARSVALRPLLDPLRADPDPQVRRVVREVLRHATPAQLWAGARQETA